MDQHIRIASRVPAQPEEDRLDQLASRLFPQYSRTRLQQWIKAGNLTVNGIIVRPRERMRGGELLEIDVHLESEEGSGAESMALDVVHEDEHLIIVNKPAGLVTHPAPGHWGGTLVNGLLHRYEELAILPRAGLVHRLDQGTSGLLVVARHLESHRRLVEMMQRREIARGYDAVVHGIVAGPGTVDLPMDRHPLNRKKMAIRRDGKPAVTHYRVVNRFSWHSHLAVKLETGRTHQIRVHLTQIHHPLVGDPVYGGRHSPPAFASPEQTRLLAQFDRQALHARTLAFRHPITGEWGEWTAPLPADMSALIAVLELPDSGGTK